MVVLEKKKKWLRNIYQLSILLGILYFKILHLSLKESQTLRSGQLILFSLESVEVGGLQLGDSLPAWLTGLEIWYGTVAGSSTVGSPAQGPFYRTAKASSKMVAGFQEWVFQEAVSRRFQFLKTWMWKTNIALFLHTVLVKVITEMPDTFILIYCRCTEQIMKPI